MPREEFRSKLFSTDDKVECERRKDLFDLSLTRRAVLGSGIAGIGTVLAWPSLAGTGTVSVYFDQRVFRISDGDYSWELNSKWFGKRCSLRVKSNRETVSVWILNGRIPATRSQLNLRFRITDLIARDPLIDVFSRQLGLQDKLELKKWLRGEQTFAGCRKQIRFVSAADRKTTLSGRIVSLDRNWEMRLQDGEVASKGVFRERAQAIRLERRYRQTSEAGIAVLWHDGIELREFFAGTKFLGATFNTENDARTLPEVYLAPHRVELKLDCETSTNATLAVDLGGSVDFSVSLTDVTAVIGIIEGQKTLEVGGLINQENTVLYYGDAEFGLQSAFPNEIFSLDAHSDRNPDFGHRFEVTSSVLPVKDLITGFIEPSLRQEIWISGDSKEPKPSIDMMIAADGAFPGLNEITPLVSEQVCAGCSVSGKPQGISYFFNPHPPIRKPSGPGYGVLQL